MGIAAESQKIEVRRTGPFVGQPARRHRYQAELRVVDLLYVDPFLDWRRRYLDGLRAGLLRGLFVRGQDGAAQNQPAKHDRTGRSLQAMQELLATVGFAQGA